MRIKTLAVPDQPTGDEYLYATFTSKDSEEKPEISFTSPVTL